MKCFNHSETDAVGICKNCQKGVCKECLSEVHNGIACKETCVDEVKLLNKIVEKSSDAMLNVAGAHKRNAIIFVIIGSVFIYTGWSMNRDNYLFYTLGGIMLFSALTSFLNFNKTNKKKDDQETLDFE
jgi:hypothetical protein